MKLFNELFGDYCKPSDTLKRKLKTFVYVLIWPVDPSYKICFWIRLGKYFYNKGYIFLCQYIECKIIKKFGCQICCRIPIGEKLNLPHPHGIIIGTGCTIGSNVTLYHNTTLGRSAKNKPFDYPVIGDNVIIYCGTLIAGKVTIGNGTTIGANSIVLHNTEINSVYVGSPAKRVR